MPELGLYDDRNRFMSPDIGRFLQPDPIGFKGDASNLYRYCGNDWANRTDPMGLMTNNDPADKMMDHLQDLLKAKSWLWKGPNPGSTIFGRSALESLGQSLGLRGNQNLVGASVVGAACHGQDLSVGQVGATQAQKGSGQAPTTVKREVNDKGFYDPYVGAPDGRSTTVYSRPWIHVKYQFAGEAATPGTVVTEKVSILDKQGIYEPSEFRPFQPQRISPVRTMGDRFSFPFVSPTGYATFTQTLSLSSGVTTTWNTTLHANGTYEIEPSTATLHY